jgi:pimeloyl-ACP methyl ester carboxylesterase
MKMVYDPHGEPICFTQHGHSHCPLVLLHGFCEDSSVWKALIPFLADTPLLCIDLPGFGKSGQPDASAMEAYASAVRTVLDHTDTERCVLVGHSMGGYVALEFASRWPERLAGLGLFHSHPFTDLEERKAARRRGIETVMAGKRDLYVSQLFPGLFAPEYLLQHPDIIQHLTAQGKKQPPDGIVNALRAMLDRRDHQKTLTQLGCPALFILGKKDGLIPYEQGLQASLLPAVSQVHLLGEVGHMGMWENTAVCASVLHSFLALCQNQASSSSSS